VELKGSEKNLSQSHFIHHKSLMECPGIEPGHPRQMTENNWPEPVTKYYIGAGSYTISTYIK
jgi:hypothetical protein